MDMHAIDFQPLEINRISQLISRRIPLVLSQEAEAAIRHTREYLDVVLDRRPEPVYGVNTGFGSLCKVRISPDDLESLQRNLILSHACGTGPELEAETIRYLLFLKIQSLSYG
nr:aromatic amino acid lyase [Chitinophagales bacterium]